MHWCRRRVRFNELPEKVPEKIWEGGLEGFGAEPAQVQQGSGEGSRKPCAKPSRVQHGSREGSGEGSGEGSEKVSEKVGEALVQSQVRFNRVLEKVPEKVWEALLQSQARFNQGSGEGSGEGLGSFGAEPVKFIRVPEKVPEKSGEGLGGFEGSGEGSGEGLGGFGAKLGQVQQGSEEGSGEGVGGFGAEPGQVQQGSKDGSGEGLGGFCAEAGQVQQVPEKVPEKVLVQSQVRFNRVPEKVPGGFGAEPGQVQQGSGEGSGRLWCSFGEALVPEKVPEKVWEALVPEKVWEALVQRFREASVQSQVKFNRVPQNIPGKVPGSRGAKPRQVQRVPGKVAEAKPGVVHLTHGNLAEVFPALGFPASFKKIYKNKTLRLLGIPSKLVFFARLTGPTCCSGLICLQAGSVAPPHAPATIYHSAGGTYPSRALLGQWLGGFNHF